jgi:uncharacterized membrane protein YphA (DoxX/SURF4 family)
MKTIKITYWATTSIVALMMAFSSYMYFTNVELAENFQRMGFPNFFRIELGVSKIIGAILLLVPVSGRVKEWVYAGFGIMFISAFIAHVASGDAISQVVFPVIFFVLLLVSYMAYHKKQKPALSIV